MRPGSFRLLAFGLSCAVPGCLDGEQGSADDIFVSTVPEPGTALLVAFGLLGLAPSGRRRRSR